MWRGSRKPGKYEPLRSLGDSQLDRAGAGLPIPVAITVALDQALGALLAMSGARQAADFQLHQALGGKADHLAQQVRVRGSSPAEPAGSSVIGGPRFRLALATLLGTVDDYREVDRPLRRY